MEFSRRAAVGQESVKRRQAYMLAAIRKELRKDGIPEMNDTAEPIETREGEIAGMSAARKGEVMDFVRFRRISGNAFS